jgi:hypothetical protein
MEPYTLCEIHIDQHRSSTYHKSFRIREYLQLHVLFSTAPAQSRLTLRLLELPERALTDIDDPVDAERLLRPRTGGEGGVTDLDLLAPVPTRTSSLSGLPRRAPGANGILASKGRFGDLDLDIDRPRPRPWRNGGGVIERSLAR